MRYTFVVQLLSQGVHHRHRPAQQKLPPVQGSDAGGDLLGRQHAFTVLTDRMHPQSVAARASSSSRNGAWPGVG